MEELQLIIYETIAKLSERYSNNELLAELDKLHNSGKITKNEALAFGVFFTQYQESPEAYTGKIAKFRTQTAQRKAKETLIF